MQVSYKLCKFSHKPIQHFVQQANKQQLSFRSHSDRTDSMQVNITKLPRPKSDWLPIKAAGPSQ